MRLLLAITVAAIQLTAPWLCCCRTEWVATALRGSHHADALCCQPETPPVEDTCCGCCSLHHPPAKKPTPAGPKKAPPCDRQDCPCALTVFVAVPADKPVHAASPDALLVPVLTLPVVAVAIESIDPMSWTGRRELPLLTTADRLFAHHVMRC